MIQTVKQNTTKRDKFVPFQLTFEGRIYKFRNTNSDFHIYVCKYGSNRHRSNQHKCKAQIGIPISETMDDETEEQKEYSIVKFDIAHTCGVCTDTIKKLISDSELNTKVEELFYSQRPPMSRTQLINKLYSHFNGINNDGSVQYTFSEQKVNSFYTNLYKKSQKIDPEYQIFARTRRNTKFELFKIRTTDPQDAQKSSLIICYCSDFQIKCMNEARFVFVDGTFDITPSTFAQVLVIMAQTDRMNVPIAYFLLPDRKYPTYAKAFSNFMLAVNVLFPPGVTFITDFELAEISAVRKYLKNESQFLQLCYFHFTQSMERHIKKLPDSNSQKELFDLVKMFPFISKRLLENVILELSYEPETRDFANYFQNNYISKFDFDDWNVYSKPQMKIISNNVVESHNKKLGLKIGKHPSLEQFEDRISEIEQEYYSKYEHKEIERNEFARYDEKQFKKYYDTYKFNLMKKKYEKNISKTLNNENTQVVDDQNTISDVSEISEEESYNDEISQDNPLFQKAFLIESRPKVNARSFPEEVKQILNGKALQYAQEPKGSTMRKRILNSAYAEVGEIEPLITLTQVRNWINNKNKSINKQ